MGPAKTVIMWVLFIIICIPLVYGIAFIDYEWKVNIAEKNIIRIYLGDEKIYEGKKAFTEIIKHEFIKPEDKVHDRTEVIIYKKLFPNLVRDKIYVDKNVRIEPGPSPSK